MFAKTNDPVPDRSAREVGTSTFAAGAAEGSAGGGPVRRGAAHRSLPRTIGLICGLPHESQEDVVVNAEPTGRRGLHCRVQVQGSEAVDAMLRALSSELGGSGVDANRTGAGNAWRACSPR